MTLILTANYRGFDRDVPNVPGIVVYDEKRRENGTLEGRGQDLMYRICTKWKEPNHLTWSEVQEKIQTEMRIEVPGGRYT